VTTKPGDAPGFLFQEDKACRAKCSAVLR